MMQAKPKTYLGNAVSAVIDSRGQLGLTTENGIATTGTIYLNPEIVTAPLNYLEAGASRSMDYRRAEGFQGKV